ncbi:hypothetical protein HOK51_05155 [Candidatus Woesearchaeota archaeon]|jgi:chemotaxis methyl-accepting protein methylase|nr:hypothetical protein [Candidatus Woesearchaeota archaeon]MBT6519215.1 hypothetical protein [Candidatus Woesearchaeota archaeon]MBT7368937.1 hypothetical protein [Candidatus Woesearchaeota archaeon]
MEELSKLIQNIKKQFIPGTWDSFLKNAGRIYQKETKQIQEDFFDQLYFKTGFFRTCVIEMFKSHAIPKIKENEKNKLENPQNNPQNKTTNILILPCANGQEVFSLATICLEEKLNSEHVKIHGADLNKTLIQEAKSGKILIGNKTINDLDEYIKQGYFSKTQFPYPQPNLAISEQVQYLCKYYEHNILNQSLIKKYDVIICTNLLIQLSREGKKTAVKNLTKNQKPGTIIIFNKHYYTPPGKLYGLNNEKYGRRRKDNEFIASLDRKSTLGLKELKAPNVYEKI